MHNQPEITFFPNGKGNAAICLRYKTSSDYRIMVYDGGTEETGKELVSYIRTQYQTDVVHDVISSHPDADHASGLQVVLAQCHVGHLWMHRPWAYSKIIEAYVNGTYLDSMLIAHFEQHIAVMHRLETLAIQKRIPVSEPFQGAKIGPMTVMSPDRNWYISALIPEFEIPPFTQRTVSRDVAYILQLAGVQSDHRPRPVSPRLPESWKAETLPEWGRVRAEMESSVVLFGRIGHNGILFTGNAGIKALFYSSAYAESQRMLLPFHLRYMQVPNHGKRSHLAPAILDRIAGPRLSEPTVAPWLTALVFASEKTRPDQCVVNALIRRGAEVAFVNGTQHQVYRFTHSQTDASAEMLMFQEDL